MTPAIAFLLFLFAVMACCAVILFRAVFDHSKWWWNEHRERVRVFEFWRARCDEAIAAYDNAPDDEKDARWRAVEQTKKRYEREVLNRK